MPDVPICALFLALYIGAGLIHQIVFIKNKKKGQKFVMSAMTFGELVSLTRLPLPLIMLL